MFEELPIFGEGGLADLRKNQLKRRWYIGAKLISLEIRISSSQDDDWHISPHEDLASFGDLAASGATNSRSAGNGR